MSRLDSYDYDCVIECSLTSGAVLWPGAGVLRYGPDGAVCAAPPRGVWRGHRPGKLPEVRSAAVLRRPPRRLLLRQGQPGPHDARPHGGRHQVRDDHKTVFQERFALVFRRDL